MKLKLPRYTFVYLGLLALGLAGGFIYWNYWGCTDSCPIDSSWKWSMVRGGTIGLCVAAIFQPKSKKGLRPTKGTQDE